MINLFKIHAEAINKIITSEGLSEEEKISMLLLEEFDLQKKYIAMKILQTDAKKTILH